MKTSEVYSRYNELCNEGKFICSQTELENFILCGLVIDAGKGNYVVRDANIKDIIVIEDLNHDFDIDFNKLLNIDLKGYGTNKVYYMSKNTYNNYKEHNLIINQNGNDYYRLFANELWLVKLL